MIVLLSLIGGSLTACREPVDPTLIALLLANDGADRWKMADEPAFRRHVKRSCRGCEYLGYNAGGDPARQLEQFRAAVNAGADVIVLNAADSETGEEIVARSGSRPVVAYDRFVPGADYFVSYDAGATGKLQAKAVVAANGAKPSILVVNGAQTDANGVAIKKARTAIFKRRKVTILAELDPQSWSADEAGAWVIQQLEKYPLRTVDAIAVGNDEQAEGVVTAILASGVPVKRLPFITGQDAELSALRRIVRGEQAMTVYKPFSDEAEQAADLAVALVTRGEIPATTDYEGVRSFIFKPQAVTVENLTDTIVRDGLYSPAKICDDATAPDCERLGIH
ncbi:MAG: substrate-binding domain-containing protein [Nocardioides sp.]